MFSLFYNICLLLIGICCLPKLAWQCLVLKKYRSSLWARLGVESPHFFAKPQEKVVWMHAVSMGEVRAMGTLFHQIQTFCPELSIVVSTTTETGLAEAKRSMPGAKAHFILPLDLSFVMNPLIKQINPAYLILCESDFWFHFLKLAASHGARVCLINGKVSERSCRRFRFFSSFSKRLFSCFDLLCLQNETHYQRFISMGVPQEKLHVTGNLKLEVYSQKMSEADRAQFKSRLGLTPSPVLVIGSTHDPEEELLLNALIPLWKQFPSLKILLVPRHPERFDTVAALLEKKHLSYQRFSSEAPPVANLILVDAMGLLNQCYQVADLAIVAGSYTSRIGGHNIFEPIQQGIPVFFGPYMHSQRELRELVLSAHAGKEVSLENLFQEVSSFLTSSPMQETYKEACKQLGNSAQGATQKTFDLVFSS